MSQSSSLTPREREILNSIVESYIETGQPVASRTISRRRKQALSPATVRNVMADLYEQGYLEQPHTSAGRLPTDKAFRVYVESLAARRLPAAELERLRNDLGGVESLAERIERSSHFLTEFTRNIGIAAAIPAAGQTLDQIELVRLADRRVLMIVVTSDGMVRDRAISVEDEISQDELTSIRNYVNGNFSGWQLSKAREELQRRLEQESAAYDAILRRLIVLYSKGLLDVNWTPQVCLEGASNLVAIDLQLTREKMRELFQALEEKKRILLLLDRFLEQPVGELGVQVGLGEAHPAMKPLSLIGINVQLAGGVYAKIAVIGPIRMNYERVMSAVLQVGYEFQEVG
ncbi:MAG TPA: heat-inducible transcriptional repressor HrcA [Bryobacteraceae bacterium]|nr:heat-inducible transcriptional repressor HrcA [Bryobacteraceae bacterium]